MNAAVTGNVTRCDTCSADIAPGLLACPGCSRLVHAAELSKLAAAAGVAEKAGDLTAALAAWRRATELLPPQTTQLATIDARMKALSAAIDGRGAAPAGVGKRDNRAGRAAGIAAAAVALLAKGKLLLLGLLKLPTLLSMLVFARIFGGPNMWLGLGVVACIYVHEIGHVNALRRYGIDASAPMFVPGLGAFVRLKQYPTDAHEEARVGLAGPLWGLVASAVAAALGLLTASKLVLGIASWSASVNLFNLIAFWQLDGARGLRALSKEQRLVVAAVASGAALALYLLLPPLTHPEDDPFFIVHAWRRCVPAAVAVFAAVRAFGTDAHPEGDQRMLALFVTLILVLSALYALPAMALTGS